ncbi:sugar transferase [Caballeronia catudaia]|nr:sugar transferase [Caballeronia catudaia]
MLFIRITDLIAVVFGAFLASQLGHSCVADTPHLIGERVAFAMALSLSAFPAFGCYRRLPSVSMRRLISRAIAAWLVVQACELAIGYLLRNADAVALRWSIAWTLLSAFGMLLARLMMRCFQRLHLWRRNSGKREAAASMRSQRALKRAFDLVTSAMLLVVLCPVFCVISLVVRRDGGRAIFGHERVGRGGKKFACLKFRTMVTDADVVLADLLAIDAKAREMWEREFKLKDDIRVTPVGRLLRATSLDELPQLWNVLRGDMSLVGPRPIVEAELEKYGEFKTRYLSATPGMTGLWQISGRNDVDYATRVSLDTAYISNWSLGEDFRILFKTFNVVLRRVGAY